MMPGRFALKALQHVQDYRPIGKGARAGSATGLDVALTADSGSTKLFCSRITPVTYPTSRHETVWLRSPSQARWRMDVATCSSTRLCSDGRSISGRWPRGRQRNCMFGGRKRAEIAAPVQRQFARRTDIASAELRTVGG